MAEQAPVIETVEIPDGVIRPGWKAPAPPRGGLGYARDLALDVGSSAIDVLTTPVTLFRDAAVDKDAAAAAQVVQHAAINAKNWLKRGKTEYGREKDETGVDNAGFVQRALEVIPQSAPALGAAALTGPFAPLTFGALGVGQQGLEAEEQIRNKTEKELYETPNYKQYRDEGLSDAEARQRVYHDMRTAGAMAPNFAANVIFGGTFGRMVGKAFNKTVAGRMRDRILRNVAQDVPEGVIGGGVQGGATEYGRQTGQIAGGLRDEYDTGAIMDATTDMAQNLGVLSTGVSALRSVRPGRPPPVPGAADRARWEGTQLLRDTTQAGMEGTYRAGQKPEQLAAEIGTEQWYAAQENINGPPRRPEPVPQATPTGEAARAPWVPAERPAAAAAEVVPPTAGVTPPPVTGETGAPTVQQEIQDKIALAKAAREAAGKPTAGITPIPEASPTVRTAADVFEEIKALHAATAAEKAMPEWRQQYQRTLAEFDQLGGVDALTAYYRAAEAPPKDEAAPAAATPSAAAEAKPTTPVATETPPRAPVATEAAPAAAAKSAFPIEELWRRARDVKETPDAGTMLKHIEEWQKANPGEKLGLTRNQLLGENKVARSEAKKAEWQAGTQKAAERKAAAKAIKEAEKKTPLEELGEVKHSKKEVEALRQKWREHERAASAKDFLDPTWQDENDRLYGVYRDAEMASRHPAPKPPVVPVGEQVKAKEAAKKAEVTPPSKPAEEPRVKTPGDLIREKLGLPPKKEGVTHGAAAQEAIDKTAREKGEAARAAWKPVIKGEKAKGKKQSEAERKAVSREDKYTQREQAAKAIIEEAKPGANMAAELEHLEKTVREGKPEEVHVELAKLASDAKEIADTYDAKLHQLGMPVKSGKKTRAGKGEYHSYVSDLRNFARAVEAALAKKDFTKAKDLTLKYVEASKLVREGEISKVTEKRAEKSEGISTEAKTKAEETEKLDVKGTDVARAAHEEEQAALEKKLEENPVQKITTKVAKSKGWGIPKRRGGRIVFDDPRYPTSSVGDLKNDYTTGVPDKLTSKSMYYRMAIERAARALGRKLLESEATDAMRAEGLKVEEGKVSDVLKDIRPGDDQPILRAIFDAVYDVTKDIPVVIWSHDAHEAYAQHLWDKANQAQLGMWSTATGRVVLRSDAMGPVTVFHEVVHAATSRALHGSERLQNLAALLRDFVYERYKRDDAVLESDPFKAGIKSLAWMDRNYVVHPGEMISPHEFIAELFSRPDLMKLVSDIKLTPAEVKLLNLKGYRADVGKSILRALWDGFLKAIGFKSSQPRGDKVAIDLLQDMFEREMFIRQSDPAMGRRSGMVLTVREVNNLAKEDPITNGGLVKAVKAFEAGDHPEAVRQFMANAEKLSPRASDEVIGYLTRLNNDYYGRPEPLIGRGDEVTPMSNRNAIQTGVGNFLNDRFGEKGKDLGFQIRNKFSTPLTKFVKGMRYTNDLGNNLEQAFQSVLKPIKDAWARREHFAVEYMDKSGANKLIDDLAVLKHAIKDRKLWEDFQHLLIKESYARSYADQPLGMGHNEHIKVGELKDRQAEQLHIANRAELDRILARDPSGKLAEMRNRIFEFGRKEMEARLDAQAEDMLLKWNIASHGDEVGTAALRKHLRRQDQSMTSEERKAFDRIAGQRDTVAYKKFEEKRNDMRKILDDFGVKGPYVPFMRHGKHAVFAEYHVTPDKGVKYNEADPTNDLHKSYDFAKLSDAEHFIDNVLGHKDVQIGVNAAHEVIYDKSTGERAKFYTPEEFEQAKKEGKKLTNRFLTSADVEQMRENNLPTDHFEARHRVTFQPTEYVRFDSERLAHQYREEINSRFDAAHLMAEGPLARTTRPQFSIKAIHVESPKDTISRANVAYTTQELQRWVDSIEASKEYQQLTEEQQADWKRMLRIESARVTMTAGRRSMHLPREYTKGASTDILKNMIEFAGSNSRALGELKYRDAIDKGLQGADQYVNTYRYGAGGAEMGKSHRERDEVMREIRQRLYAPPRVEDSWATGIKRGLQVSMISHLADTGYLIVNAIEPWVFGAAITAARHGWVGSYSELAKATVMINPLKMAMHAGQDMAAAIRGDFRAHDYEKLLLDSVKNQPDAVGLQAMLQHMFHKGLAARDVGMEVERIHDPSKNIAFRALDRVDNVFRGANVAVETLNRASMAIANYRLEMRRAARDGVLGKDAQEQAVRYAEDSIFKGAGDYGQWNNPRYLNNPFMKLAGQFKKYPLRIASVYADAIIQAFRGDKQAMKQVAYMLAAQGITAGALGLPIGTFAGTVNAAYLLGLSDNNWNDVEFGMRKWLVDQGIDTDSADLGLRGALRLTGADMHGKLSQSSLLFFGSPDSRDAKDLLSVMGRMALGAPGDVGTKFFTGWQKIIESIGHFDAGADAKGWEAGLQGADGLIQMKFIHNIAKSIQLMTGDKISGLPVGDEGTTGNAIIQALGFQPTSIARKLEERRVLTREKKKESTARNVWVSRWRDAPNTTEQRAVWDQIQKQYNSGIDPKLRIQYQDLWKAQQRKKQEARHDDLKMGVRLSGRQKAIGSYVQHAYSEE